MKNDPNFSREVERSLMFDDVKRRAQAVSPVADLTDKLRLPSDRTNGLGHIRDIPGLAV